MGSQQSKKGPKCPLCKKRHWPKYPCKPVKKPSPVQRSDWR